MSLEEIGRFRVFLEVTEIVGEAQVQFDRLKVLCNVETIWIAGQKEPRLYLVVSGNTEGEVSDFCAFQLGLGGKVTTRVITSYNHK